MFVKALVVLVKAYSKVVKLGLSTVASNVPVLTDKQRV